MHEHMNAPWPTVGGITSALVTVLVVFPAIFAIWKGRHVRGDKEGVS